MAAPLLALRDIRLADGPRMLFEGVDIALEPGTRACLIGANGSGKSTLLRLLAGVVEADGGERFMQPGLAIALVEQEPTISGPSLRAWAAGDGAIADHRAEAALESFGLDPAASCEGLSGGEARRAALARAFAAEPDVLLLDEPTNHLDILAIEALEVRLGRTSAAWLTVSHDRAFLERVTRRCYWLRDRQVRRRDQGFAGFDAWAEALDREGEDLARRQEAALRIEERWLARGVTGRRARNEGRRRRLLALREDKAERLRRESAPLAMAGAAAGASGRLVVEAKGLAKALGGRTLVSGFSTRILRGDRVAIVGPNGAGKTTLVRMLLGETPPDAGSVRHGAGLEIAYVDQARAALADGLTLKDALAPGGGDQVMAGGAARHVAAYAKDFGFREAQLRQAVTSLSGGERNRLLLARALAAPSNLMVLDEPTNDLDMETLDLLEDVLADYSGTLILISHDRDFIDRLATSTIALDGRGRVVETPGGWRDFQSQNPGFLDPPARTAPAASSRNPPSAARARRPAAKLSFRDAHRLEQIEARLPGLAETLAALEARLADPGLYARDAAGFAAASAGLAALQAEQHALEEEWFTLSSRREALESGAGEDAP